MGNYTRLPGRGPYSANSTRELFLRRRDLKIKKKNCFNYTCIMHPYIKGVIISGLTVSLSQTSLLPTRENSWSLDESIRFPTG